MRLTVSSLHISAYILYVTSCLGWAVDFVQWALAVDLKSTQSSVSVLLQLIIDLFLLATVHKILYLFVKWCRRNSISSRSGSALLLLFCFCFNLSSLLQKSSQFFVNVSQPRSDKSPFLSVHSAWSCELLLHQRFGTAHSVFLFDSKCQVELFTNTNPNATGNRAEIL